MARRIEAQLADELVAVDPRHQHVGDHEVGPFGAHRNQAGAAVGGFEQPMTATGEERGQHVPVTGQVVDDQNSCHTALRTQRNERGRQTRDEQVGGKREY